MSRGFLVIQVGVIVALGSAIGLADAFVFRPIQLGRAEAPSIEQILANKPKPAPEPTRSSPPAPIAPAPTATSPTPTPTPAQPVAVTSPSFVPTPKDKLPKGHITLADAKALFDSAAVFVDSRRKDKYEELHVKGAWRIELSDFAGGNPPALGMIPRESIIVVYCSGGNCDESEKVAQMLDGSGYRTIYVLHDGIPGWSALGYPTETGPGLLP